MAAAALGAIKHAEALREFEDVTTDSTLSDEYDSDRFEDAAVVTEIPSDVALQLTSARVARRKSWMQLWTFAFFLTLYTVMMVSWMDIGMLGRQQRTWKQAVADIRWEEPSRRRPEGKGPEQVASVADYFSFVRAFVTWIHENDEYGYSTEPRETGHVLKYTNVMRYASITRVRARELVGDEDCPPPPWVTEDVHHIFTPLRCYQFASSAHGSSTIEEDPVYLDLNTGLNGTLAQIDAAVPIFDGDGLIESAIEVWTHNPQTRWSARLRILFVFNMYGEAIFEGLRLFPVRLYPYGKGKDYFVMVCQILYMLCLSGFLFLVLLRRFVEVVTGAGVISSLVSHFTSVWNLLDWTTTTMGFVGMISHIVFVVSGGRDNLLFNTQDEFTWSWIPSMTRYVLGIVSMFYSWKMLQYFEFDHNTGMLIKTLKLAWNTLTFYAATLTVILVGYAIGGNIIVGGTGTPDFLTFSATFQSCLQITTGAISLGQILPSEASHPATKAAVALWYWTLIILVFFVLVNLFIAVILDAYSLLADPSVEALLSYSNFIHFVGEGVRVMKQFILTTITRTPNGRITAIAETFCVGCISEVVESGRKTVSLVELNQKISHVPGAENLIDWLVEMTKKVAAIREDEEIKRRALRKEARAIKKQRRAEMLEKFGVAI